MTDRGPRQPGQVEKFTRHMSPDQSPTNPTALASIRDPTAQPNLRLNDFEIATGTCQLRIPERDETIMLSEPWCDR